MEGHVRKSSPRKCRLLDSMGRHWPTPLRLERQRSAGTKSRALHLKATMPNRKRAIAMFLIYAALLAGAASAQQPAAEIDRQMPMLLENYKALHQHPELSHHETWTA